MEQESPANARALVERLDTRVQRLQRFPRSGPQDTNAPSDLPQSIEARMARESGFTVRYLFPVPTKVGKKTILVVSVRRGTRMLMDDAEFLARYLGELERAE